MRRRRPAGRERGQMVVLAALVLATILVGLALVLNSGIYAENLATRQTADTSDVATAVVVAQDEAAHTMTVVNREGHADHDAVNDSFDVAVANWSVAMADRRATRGQAFDVGIEGRSTGWRLAQNRSDRNFTSVDGDGDWRLLTEVDELAGFRLDVQREMLYDGSDPLDETGFYVVIENGTHEWRVYAVEDDGSDEVVVFGGFASDVDVTDFADLGADEECRAGGDTVEIDLSARTVAGEHCEALAVDDALSGSVNVSYANAGELNGENRSGGTWELLVREGADVEDANLGTPGEQPHRSAALYDATVRVEFERSDLRHGRTRSVLAEPLAYVAGS